VESGFSRTTRYGAVLVNTGRLTASVVLGLAGLLAVACSGSPSAPSVDSASGVWIGKATLSAVSGGECVGPTLASAIGSRDMFAASIRQAAADVTATVAYQGNRTSCVLSGTVGDARVGMNLTSCHAGRIERLTCSNGVMRDVGMLSDRITAAVVNGTGTGTDVSTWNVFEAGGTVPLGVLTLTAEFRWNISRLPHDDFHIFDGSILTGYVDSVVTIPEEPDPFCTRCGWF